MTDVTRWHDTVSWKRISPMLSEPRWVAVLERLRMLVRPYGDPWVWRWEIENEDGMQLARGEMEIEHGDSAVWHFQGDDVVQKRCQLVARALQVPL